MGACGISSNFSCLIATMVATAEWDARHRGSQTTFFYAKQCSPYCTNILLYI